MRFDPESPNYVFSEEQLLPPGGSSEIRKALRQKGISAFQDSFRSAREAGTGGGVRLALGSMLFLGIFGGVIAAAVTGHPAIAAVIFGSAFVLIGLLMLFGGVISTDSARGLHLPQHLMALLVILLGLSIAVPMLLIGRLGSAAAFILMMGLVFGFGALFLIAGAVTSFRDSRFRGEETEGECIGYARYLSGSSSRHRARAIETAPVFRYYYAGEVLEALASGSIGNPEELLGASYPLTVDTRDKYHIRRADKKPSGTGGTVLLSLMALMFLAASVFLLYTAAHTDPSETVQVRRGDGKAILTDQDITNKTGKPADAWEVLYLTVTSNVYSEDDSGWLIDFSDGSRQRAAEQRIAEQYAVGHGFYFVTDKTTEEILTVYSGSSYSYSGSRLSDRSTGT